MDSDDCLAGLMLFLSRQQGKDTVRLSVQLSHALAEILAWIGVSVNQGKLHLALRTAAHFGVYFIWTMLLYGAFCNRAGSGKGSAFSGFLRPAIRTLALCVVVAILDEMQKKWIPGRHCSWDEAALNCIGALTGTILRILLPHNNKTGR